jgi:hypothetical protein
MNTSKIPSTAIEPTEDLKQINHRYVSPKRDSQFIHKTFLPSSIQTEQIE